MLQFCSCYNFVGQKENCYYSGIKPPVKIIEPIASICPLETPSKEKTLCELKELLKKLPRLGDEVEKFEMDLKEIIKHQPSMPEKNKWA